MPDDSRITIDETGLFSKEEEATLATVKRSKVWRLMRDALALERERLNQRPIDPESKNLAYVLGKKEGALDQINRLLREGPNLVVYFQRYMRAQAEKGEEVVTADAPPRPGEPPDLET